MELTTDSKDVIIQMAYSSVRGLLQMNQVDVNELVYHPDWQGLKQEINHIQGIEEYHMRLENARYWCDRVWSLIRKISRIKRGLK